MKAKLIIIISKPMIPPGAIPVTLDAIQTKMYGDGKTNMIPLCLGVPQAFDMYAIMVQNPFEALAEIKDTQVLHRQGFPHLDKWLDHYLFTGSVNQETMTWHYKPSNGYIHLKPHDIPVVTKAAGETARYPGGLTNASTDLGIQMEHDKTTKADVLGI